MMHCSDSECGWAWKWDENPTAHCPFCGSIGMSDESAPPEAKTAISQASGEAFEGGHAAML